MEDVFAMVMLVNIDKCTVDFNTLIDLLDKDGEELGMKIHTMHEDIFEMIIPNKLTESRAGNRFSTLNFSGGLVKCL